MIIVATKSFLKNVIIKDKKTASTFVSALENAEKRERKNVKIASSVKTIEDKETIKKMFRLK